MPTDLNTASLHELQRLPGIGPVLAQRIVASRPFTTFAQLHQVQGIGPKRYLALVSDRLVTLGHAANEHDGKHEVKPEPKTMVMTKDPSSTTRVGATASKERLVDLNDATLRELCSLHGVGPVLAQRIVAARPFRRKDEVTAVCGIGLLTYEKMQHQLAQICSMTYHEEEQDDSDDDSGDRTRDSDKENEPQAASPTRRPTTTPVAPAMSPRASSTASRVRPPRRRLLTFCDAPSRNLLGDIRASVLPHTSSKLLIASWNIRNLSKKRDAEPLHRVADILEQFDVVAMQEVRDTIVLRRLKHFMPGWDYIASPLVGTEDTDSATSSRRRAEHFAFFYRRRVVAAVGAGCVGAADDTNDNDEDDDANARLRPPPPRPRMVRPPYVATFKTMATAAAPALQLTLVNVHVVCGDHASKQQEMNELWRLTTQLQSHESNKHRNLMLLGDFNLSPQEIECMGLGDRKFEPLVLSPLATTVGEKLLDNIWLNCRGDWHTVDVESGVYRIDWAFYPRARARPRAYETQATRLEAQSARVQCTLELSDHCPVWIALGAAEEDEQAE